MAAACATGHPVPGWTFSEELLFVQNETDPYWKEVMGQNLKGYPFYGDPEVPLRRYGSLFQGY